MAYGSIRVDKTTVYFGQQVTFTPSFFEYENNVVVTYSFAGTSTRTGAVFTGEDLDQYGKYTWTVPAGLAQYCSGESGACTITAKFYVGSTLTGTRTLTLSFLAYRQQVVRVPDSVAKNGANFGDSVTLTTGRYGAISGVDLRYSFTGSSTTAGSIATGVTSSYNWTVPNLAANCISSVSGICTITATCKVGDVAVRTETVQITLKVPDTAAYKPSLPSGSITLTEANSAVTSSGLGVYLQGESKVTIAVNPTTAYQSPIVKCAITFDGNGYTDTSSPFSITSATITKSGTDATRSVAWTVTVTDQRGRSASANGTITAYLYNRPSITTQFTGQRCDSSGTYQHDGTIVKVTFAGKYTVLSNNSYTTKIAYSADNGSTYTDAKSYTASSGAVSASNDKLTNITYLNTTKYLMRLTLADKLYTTTAVITIPTLKVLLDFRADGTGLGIGMINQNANAIDSAWTYKGTYVQCQANSFLQAYRTDYSANATPSTNIWGTIAAGYDSNNAMRAYIRQIARTNGDQGVQLEAMRVVNGENKYNTLNLHIDASGNKNVNVSDPAAWRSALGLGSMALEAASSYLPVAGGTMTGRIDTKITSWDNATTPSSNRSYDTHYVTDANNRSMTFQRIHHGADNVIGVEYGVRRQISDSSTLWNTLRLNMAANGTASVSVNQPAAWRTALGLGTMATQAASSYLPLTGGTLTGSLTGTYITSKNYYQTHIDGSVYVLNARNADGSKHRGAMNLSATNNWWWTEYTTTGGSATESYGLPAPTRTASGNSGYTIATTKFLQRGTVNPSSIAANGYKSGTITFATPYTNTPVVVVGLYGGNDNVSAFGDVSVRVKGFGKNASTGETTGFTYEIDNANSSSRNIGMMWMAFADS